MSYWNPKYYNELRKKEKVAQKNQEIEHYNQLAKSHDEGTICGQQFPGDGRWMNEKDRKEMIKRNVLIVTA